MDTRSRLPIPLEELLRGVEEQRIEYKSGWDVRAETARKVVETVSAFANDYLNLNGGYVVLGVEDDGHGRAVLPPKGLDPNRLEEIQRQVVGLCSKLLQPEYQPIVVPEEMDGRHLLVIWAPASRNRPHSCSESRKDPPRFFVRTGAQTRLAKGELLHQLHRMSAPVPFDDDIAPGRTLADLSSSLLHEFLRETGREDLLEIEDSTEIYRLLGLTVKVNGYEAPKNAALLFFHHYPERIYPGAFIRFAEFPDDAGGNVIEEKVFAGPLHHQIKECVNFLRGRLTRRVQKHPDRPQTSLWLDYPEEAIEEAVVNALHHRDYKTSTEATLVRLFPDALEITSYPGPDPALRQEDFRPGRPVPKRPARNRLIGDLLRHVHLVEKLGTGVPKIYRAMEKNGSPEPEFRFDDGLFAVILPRRRGEEKKGPEERRRPRAETTARSMRNTIGIPVRRENFFNRELEIRELKHLMTRGHVLMLAPRRVGKTSLLYRLWDDPPEGWLCLFMSVESLTNEAQFVARLLAEISQAHPGGAWIQRFGFSLRKILDRGTHAAPGSIQVKLAEEIGHEWQDVGATVLSVLREIHGKTFVMVDEFPIFVRRLLVGPEGEMRTRHFLDWFREIRNVRSAEGETHFLLTGSLGLDAVVRAVEMTSTINDLATFHLGPLSNEQAEALLKCLSKGEEFPLTAEIRSKILRYIDWHVPYLLQLLFGELLNLVKFQGFELSEELVDRAYARLLASAARGHFHHWVERLEDPLLSPEERDLAKDLLAAAALDPNGLTASAIVQIREKHVPDLNEQDILANLEYYGYLSFDEERWRFTSSLLRDWWLKWQVGAGASLHGS